MYIALDQHYIDQATGELLIGSFRKLSIMINNFIAYLKDGAYKGLKYKTPKKTKFTSQTV
jgi:hypothetical protein